MMTSIPNPSRTSLRFSQVKRKPPPEETVVVHHSAADLHDAFIWEPRNQDKPEISYYSLPRPPTPSDDTHNRRESLNESGSTPPSTVPRQRPRAYTVPSQPSQRFANLVRIPPPAVDIHMLTSARNTGALRAASLRTPAITTHVSHPAIPTISVDKTAAEDDIPPSPSWRSFRKGSFDFIPKKRRNTLGQPGRISVASISSPVTLPRKLSGASMDTTNASVVSLSAFPQPPQIVRPVPDSPSLAYNPPSPTLSSLRSFIHADPPIDPSPPPNGVQVEGIENPDIVQPNPEPQPSDNGKVEGTEDSSTQATDSHVQPRYPYTLSVDPPTLGAGLPSSALVKGKSPMPREAHFDFGEPPDFDGFDETQLPTQRQLKEAAALQVISESGVRVAFGSLWQDQKTIVCFIRHFWCPLCQDYMFSISRNVAPEVLHNAGIKLVIISNGSYEMIKSYRRIFRTPFALYTDPTHNVYNALGMTLQTMESGPRGSYVRHGIISGIGMVVVNAVKVGMPVWKQGGEISQLGGEFILGPGMTCSWVHRMRYTRSHVPILQVIQAAGVDMYTPLNRALSSTGSSFLGISSKKETKWMERRRKALRKLREKKLSRRGGTQWIDTASTTSSDDVNRSSVGNEVAGSLCSWEPSTEEAINVGLIGYETGIIEEAEEEEEGEAESEQEHPPLHDLWETRSESPSKSDTKSDSGYTDSFDDHSERGSSTTDADSTVDGHSAVEVHFDQVDVHFDSKLRRDSLNSGSFSARSSYSSMGSGYEQVVDDHRMFFGNIADKRELLAVSMSESSLGSF